MVSCLMGDSTALASAIVRCCPIISSDAAWYCRHDPEEERFYEIFFKLCKKYNVRWVSADEKEKQFLSEVARVTYERDKAKRLGLPLSKIRPSFTQ